MRLISGCPDSSWLFTPGHPRGRVQYMAVAQRSIASQLFTGSGSMQGGSLRRAGDPRGQRGTQLVKFRQRYRSEVGTKMTHHQATVQLQKMIIIQDVYLLTLAKQSFVINVNIPKPCDIEQCTVYNVYEYICELHKQCHQVYG